MSETSRRSLACNLKKVYQVDYFKKNQFYCNLLECVLKFFIETYRPS